MAGISVLLLDNRPLVRMGLRSMLSEQRDIVVVAVAEGLAEAVALAEQSRPTVVLLSVHNGPEPAETVAALRHLEPAPSVLVLSGHPAEDAQYAEAGVAGVVLEQSDEYVLLSAVRAVAAGYAVVPAGPGAVTPGGGPTAGVDLEQLTQREFDVFELIASGHSNAEIAQTLLLTKSTVKSHVRSLLVKLGLRNRVEAAIYAHELARSRPESRSA